MTSFRSLSVSITIIVLGLLVHSIESALPRAKDYLVGLRPNQTGTNYCAGALVSTRYVLTSNLCSLAMRNAFDFDDTEQYAVIGSNYISGNRGGITYKIAETLVYPDYDNVTLENDYLLLKLSDPSKLTPVAMLPNNYTGVNPFVVGSLPTVMGRGIPSEPPAEAVYSTPMQIMDSAPMEELATVYDNEFALLPQNRNVGCRADLGSPVVGALGTLEYLGDIVTGINGCRKTNQPYAVSNVESAAKAWINGIIFQ